MLHLAGPFPATAPPDGPFPAPPAPTGPLPTTPPDGWTATPAAESSPPPPVPPYRPAAFRHTTVAHGSGGWSRISASTDRPRSSKARVGTDPKVMRTA